MYVACVPNRRSPPAYLLREGYRDAGKVKTQADSRAARLHRQIVKSAIDQFA